MLIVCLSLRLDLIPKVRLGRQSNRVKKVAFFLNVHAACFNISNFNGFSLCWSLRGMSTSPKLSVLLDIFWLEFKLSRSCSGFSISGCIDVPDWLWFGWCSWSLVKLGWLSYRHSIVSVVLHFTFFFLVFSLLLTALSNLVQASYIFAIV